jgi:predicted GNAT family acetyltransferase
VIQRGPNFVSVTPQADGSLRITNTFVDEASRGQGAGQKNLVDAAKYAQAKGLPLTGDKTVHASQLRAYEAAKKKGLIDFDYATPELAAQAAKIIAEKGSSKVLNGKGSPVTVNIRIPSKLGDQLGE